MTPPPAPPALVLVAAAGVAAELGRLLAPAGIEVRDLGGDPVAEAAAHVVVADVDRIGTLPAGRPPAPVLALVRRDEPDDVAAAVSAGAHDVLARPFDGAEVRARVAAAVRLSAAEATLRDRNAELVAWAHRAGHDLLTPLAVISGMAETLEVAWDRLAEADRARLLASIRNQATRATEMLDEAFSLAKGPPEEPGEGPGPGG